MIKVSVHQEDITTLNVYAPSNRASKHLKQNPIELQGDKSWTRRKYLQHIQLPKDKFLEPKELLLINKKMADNLRTKYRNSYFTGEETPMSINT